MSTFADNVFFEVITPGCGCVPFAMEYQTYLKRREDHKNWHCPNCGALRHFLGESVQDKKVREAEAARDRAQREANHARSDAREVNKQYVKIRNRVRKGMCPCCNETFQNLAQHMQAKHPEFGGPDLLRSLREAYGLTQAALGKEIGNIAASMISCYETGKSVSSFSKRLIESWLAKQVTL